MKVTILGASPAIPNPGGACTGLLIEAGDTSLLVDCGPGVMSQLERHLDFHDLTAVLITHLHADHCLDLVMLRNGLKYAPSALPKPRPHLFLPPASRTFLNELGHLFTQGEPNTDFFGDQFHIEEYEPSRPLHIGPLTLTFAPTRHYIDCWAVRIENAGRVLAFSSDTGPGADLTPIAQGADLFICEAGVESRASDPNTWGHLAPDEAGQIARSAGARRLTITHIWHGYDQPAMRAAAAAAFGGPTEVAAEGRVYHLPE
ncbi:MAG: MBL fold metallo-hydrolase [Anaerolineae bacterium]|nr:MBL fold metallo-hydrolase [Anaerolineae bacterium]